MGIAAGGQIDQAIVQDQGTHHWHSSETKWFNVQILNSIRFQQITGLPPPETPANAQTYAEHGYPFFDMWEEPTAVAGNFSGVKSIGQIDGVSESPLRLRNITTIGRRKSSKAEAPASPKWKFTDFFRKRSTSPPATATAASTPPHTDSDGASEVTFFHHDATLPVFRSLEELERDLA